MQSGTWALKENLGNWRVLGYLGTWRALVEHSTIGHLKHSGTGALRALGHSGTWALRHLGTQIT